MGRYGSGFGAESLASVSAFGGAYMLVIIAEPLVDLALLAAVKTLHALKDTGLVNPRLYQGAL